MREAKKITKNSRWIVLLDDHVEGHHTSYMQILAVELLKAGYSILVMFPDVGVIKQYVEEHVSESSEHVKYSELKWEPVVPPFWMIRRWYCPVKRWNNLSRSISALEVQSGIKVDCVFFCWADGMLDASHWLLSLIFRFVFSYNWTGLYFHPRHLRIHDVATERRGKRQERLLKSKRCKSIGILDEELDYALRGRIHKNVRAVPDFTVTNVKHRVPSCFDLSRHIQSGYKVVGIIGDLSRRKGVLSFLQVAKALSNEKIIFVVAGAWSDVEKRTFSCDELDEIDCIFRNPPPNLVRIPEYIPNEGIFNYLISKLDLLLLMYVDFPHSSNLLTKAASFGVPVVVSDGYCMANRVKKYNLGIVAKPTNEDVCLAIKRITMDSCLSNLGCKPNYDAYTREHSLDKLRPVLTDLIS